MGCGRQRLVRERQTRSEYRMGSIRVRKWDLLFCTVNILMKKPGVWVDP